MIMLIVVYTSLIDLSYNYISNFEEKKFLFSEISLQIS